jgi:RNA polymerase sigma-70 factor (ECF subfamily)
LREEDASLLERCKRNDGVAWRFLVARYSGMVYTIAYNFTADSRLAEDLTQEIFLKVYTSLKRFDPKKNFKQWLSTVARNHCIDDYRKRRARREVPLGSDEVMDLRSCETPFSAYARKEKAGQVRTALLALPEGIRIALVLRDLYGYSYEEVSAKLKLPMGTVKSRINRGRIALARALSDNLRITEKDHEMP